jgi:hypothetical protein
LLEFAKGKPAPLAGGSCRLGHQSPIQNISPKYQNLCIQFSKPIKKIVYIYSF